jgi:hypothetical protein
MSDREEIWATRAVVMVEKLEDEGAKKVVKLDSEIKRIRKTGLKTMKKLRSQVYQPSPLPGVQFPVILVSIPFLLTAFLWTY